MLDAGTGSTRFGKADTLLTPPLAPEIARPGLVEHAVSTPHGAVAYGIRTSQAVARTLDANSGIGAAQGTVQVLVSAPELDIFPTFLACRHANDDRVLRPNSATLIRNPQHDGGTRDELLACIEVPRVRDESLTNHPHLSRSSRQGENSVKLIWVHILWKELSFHV